MNINVVPYTVILVITLVLVFNPVVEAITVKTRSGDVYENAQLFKAEEDRVMITFSGSRSGMVTILYDDLTADSQKHFVEDVARARQDIADKESALQKKINEGDLDLSEWSRMLLGKNIEEIEMMLGEPDRDDQKLLEWTYFKRVKVPSGDARESLMIKYFEGVIVDV